MQPTFLLLVGSAVGCASTPDDDPTTTFESVFTLVSTVELEEPPDDPIVAIEHVGMRPEGGFVIADEAAGRVRLFDDAGRLERTLGRPGDGPGELDGPTGAVELPDGRVVVVQRADPRLTIFLPGDSTETARVPGQYGFWADRLGDRVVAGLGSRTDRFALLSDAGDPISTFGRVDPTVNEVPFWIFFARERAAVVGAEIAINTSFFPQIRFFSADGDSVRAIGGPGPSWIEPTPPPVERASDEGAADQITEWSTTFTVVSSLAAVSDSLLVVQYGRYVPVDRDPYGLEPFAIDLYEPNGTKLVEDVPTPHRVVGGGEYLALLVAEPPAAWTLALYEWTGPSGRAGGQ